MYSATKAASPVLSPREHVKGFSLCPSRALGSRLRLSFPEEAFIQSPLGGPSKQG